MTDRRLIPCAALLLALPLPAWAQEAAGAVDLTHSAVGYVALAIFVLAYLLVMSEEFTHLRKSKPVILAAGIIWGMVAWVYVKDGIPDAAEHALRQNLLEFAELFLFLLAAMTYVNAMDERQIFEALRAWLVRRGFGYRRLFWLMGILAFFISPVIDNLTTALVMCAVVLAVGRDNPRFVSLSCINIVVGANAGGAFSPFGDITTLMVWQKGIVHFWTFFLLFVPAVVNFVVPAAIMHFAVPAGAPQVRTDVVHMRRGAVTIMVLFASTIVTAVCFHQFLHMPPMLGMMTGLAYLKFYGYYLKKTHVPLPCENPNEDGQVGDVLPIRVFGYTVRRTDSQEPFDIFGRLARAEWDTLLFFYGVVLCVGALGFIGYLHMLSHGMYAHLGPTFSNVMVGILSAVVDNIPVMFAVLSMNPDMSLGQWLLVTMTAGVGGSMLSIGSAAGVALMGQARGMYTFFSHLRWTPVIALGYAASIWAHMLVNAQAFAR